MSSLLCPQGGSQTWKWMMGRLKAPGNVEVRKGFLEKASLEPLKIKASSS
jgi:hypothetical protein